MQANRRWQVAAATAPGRHPGRMAWLGAPVRLGRRVMATVRAETAKDGIYLVPLRAFIGIGWIR